MPFSEAFQEVVTIGYGYLIALALSMARGMGVVIILPVFVRTGITGILRTGVVIAVALPLLPYTLAEIARAGEPGTLLVMGIILKEGFIGFLLGLVFGIPFWGLQSAGDVIDLQRGSIDANISDPSETSEASVTGTFLVLTMITLFFVAGGMTIIIETLYQSYGIWPLFALTPTFSLDAAAGLFGLLDQMLKLAFVVAGPVIIAMFLGDAVLATITRFAPQLNVFVLSMGVKSAIFVALLPIYATFIIDHIGDAFAPLHDAVEHLRRMIR